MTTVTIHAPMPGWVSALEDVPDPVFSDKMMGDGLAIDPLDGILRAPCDGDVIAVAPTAHAVTLLLDNGAHLLLHIGLETVAMRGTGFAVATAVGARVRLGDPLISFDLEAVACAASSVVTPMFVANEGYAVRALACDRVVAAGEPLMAVSGEPATRSPGVPTEGERIARNIVVPTANGIHARPAARIAAALRPFAADVQVRAHGRSADARSPVGLLTLGVAQGDTLQIAAHGKDAAAAVAVITGLIETGMGEGDAPRPAAVPLPAAEASAGPLFRGVCAAPGLAIGPVVRFAPDKLDVPEQGTGAMHESAALDAAIAGLAAELALVTGPGTALREAHRALLEDPQLRADALPLIAQGKSAAFAWRSAIARHADALRVTGNALLIERIADLVDLEQQVIARLLGQPAATAPVLPPGAILIADDLLPSQFLLLDATHLTGVVTAAGGPTSHVALLAAAAGIPMLVATGPGPLEIAADREVVLDATSGILDADPTPDVLAQAAQRRGAQAARRVIDAAGARDECAMADGTRIEVFANLGSVADARRAVELGAEGCGLLRTEFLFLDRTEAPSEAEQRAIYADIAAALDGRPLIVRTLDIGADKPVPYLVQAHEDNPALGRRGIRLGLHQPDLLATQLRAILAGVPATQCRVMVPMIVDREELRAVRQIFDTAARDVGVGSQVPLGVMIETPAAALLADSLAAEADFLSIGTNDLTQYALAADRCNPALATMLDPLHPAVLRLIASAAAGAVAHGRWIGVCGSLASDPRAAALLIGLGITELSATPGAVAALKARIRTLRLEACRALAARALAATSVHEVRALLEGEA